jgi:hypothetical protein
VQRKATIADFLTVDQGAVLGFQIDEPAQRRIDLDEEQKKQR